MYIIQKIKLLIVLFISLLFLNGCFLEKFTTTEYSDILFDFSTDARNSRRVSVGSASEIFISVSPDNRYIAFSREVDQNVDIYIKSIISGKEYRLTEHPAEDIHPSWAPDMRSVFFTSMREDPNGDIYKVRLKLHPDRKKGWKIFNFYFSLIRVGYFLLNIR